MAASVRQFVYVDNSASGATNWTGALGSNVLAGSLIVVAYSVYGSTADPVSISDNLNAGTYSQDGKSPQNTVSGDIAWLYSRPNSAAGALTVSFAGSSSFYQAGVIMEITGAAIASPKDVTNTAENDASNGFTPSSFTLTTVADHDIIIAALSLSAVSLPTVTAGSGLTLIQQNTQTAVTHALATMKVEDAGTAGGTTITESYSGGSASTYDALLAVAYKIPAAASPTPPVGTVAMVGVAGRMDRGLLTSTTLKGQT